MKDMTHIKDVWEFIDNYDTEEDLEKAFREIPSKFGSFEIVNKRTYKEDGYFEICHSYWDENLEYYNYVYHTIDYREEN